MSLSRREFIGIGGAAVAGCCASLMNTRLSLAMETLLPRLLQSRVLLPKGGE